MSTSAHITDSSHNRPLSIAVISPDRRARILATDTFKGGGNVRMREFLDYPPTPQEGPQMVDQGFDAVLIDLDANTTFALALVEAICTAQTTVVMVFSKRVEPELMLRSMRAGAREFFTVPFAESIVAKALHWLAGRRQELTVIRKAAGRMFVFFGAKGGVGVTAVASNFALALAEHSPSTRTLLIDLNLQLGDAALNLGMVPKHSTVEALAQSTELDVDRLRGVLDYHDSGLCVLAAPAIFHEAAALNSAIGRLLEVARQEFDHIVVDAGKKVDLKQMHLFEESATAYLITQVGIPELRNANRLISQFSNGGGPTLEIVINRYQERLLGLSDEDLAKALTRPVRWKVPNDFSAVQTMHKTGNPVLRQSSPIARVLREMAASVSVGQEQPVVEEAATTSGFRFPWKGFSQKVKAAAPLVAPPVVAPVRAASGLR